MTCVVGTFSSLGNVTLSKVWVGGPAVIGDEPLNVHFSHPRMSQELVESPRTPLLTACPWIAG
jgi:hypothetical protein